MKSARGPKASTILWLWVTLGLAAGLLHVGVLHGVRLWLGTWLRHGPQIVWLASAAEILWMAPFAVPLLLLSHWGRGLPLNHTTTILALPAWLSVLLAIPKLYKWAIVLLAIGLAVETGRWATHFEPRLGRWLPRCAATLAAVVALLAALVHVGPWQAERAALAQLPVAPPNAPNVILIVLDTLRAREMSLYGYSRDTTPRLNALASKGVTIARAISTAPWTLPSHASMMTGLFPDQLRADWLSPFDRSRRTLSELFAARGYRTGGFVANVWSAGYEAGIDRGFSHFEDYKVSGEELLISSQLGANVLNYFRLKRALDWYDRPGRKRAHDINTATLRWIGEGRNAQRPFFAFLNFFDAHHPYLPAKPHWAPDTRRQREVVGNMLTGGKLPPDIVRVAVDSYDDSIREQDERIGELFGRLEERGLLGNTLVFITSDHGEEMDEHNMFDHGNSLYRQGLEVPLIILDPRHVPRRRLLKGPVSLVHLAATICDLAGVPKAESLPGESLAPLWLSEAEPDFSQPVFSKVNGGINTPREFPVSRGDMRSVVADGFHLIRNGDGKPELYNFETDVEEHRDLAADPAHRVALLALEQRIDKFLRDVVVKR